LQVDDWTGPLAALGDRFESTTRSGTPVADTLLDVAAEVHADLLVVGTRGLGGFTGLRIGGVALAVLHRCDRPVVLVPPDDAD
jgi:nucleotide-binding universal stress UspA family protein